MTDAKNVLDSTAPLKTKDKLLLLELAHKSIEAEFNNESIDLSRYKQFNSSRGCFVTLKKHDELRGCIGFIEPIYPLNRLISTAAQHAAFGDPRFRPLEKQELKDVKLEISILTKPELIVVNKPEDYLKKIIIGRDGLIIESFYGQGLLLPQVATEYSFTPEQFLECVCEKAGLARDAWKNLRNKIYRFSAEIFGD